MKRISWYLIISIALIALWQWAGSSSDTVRLLLSSPSHMVSYFSENAFDLIEATGITFWEALLGLLVGIVLSFGTMILCFYKPKLMDIVLPVMVASQVIPLIVLAPFFIILLGMGVASKVAMAALMSFFPVFVNFAQGYKAISINTHELMTIYQAPLSYRIKNVYFPLSMPSIMAGLKVSATLAVIGAIVAEFNGTDFGLGKNLFLSAKRLEPDLMMVSLFLSTLLGIVMYSSIMIIERFFGKWYL